MSTWISMLRNYLKTALRSMRRHMAYSVINVLGLSVGLVVSFLILMWVQDELRYDTFHEEGDQLYRVMRTAQFGDGQIITTPAVTIKLHDILDEEFPEITHSTLQGWEHTMTFTRGEETFKESGIHASEEYFDLFTYPFLAGDPATALAAPNSVVISETLARKYFSEHFQGTASAREAAQRILGESLHIDNRFDAQITGVFEDVPEHSSIQFDFMLPFDELMQRHTWLDDWGNNVAWTLVKLTADADAAAVTEKIRHLVTERSEETNTEIFLQPYADMYLKSDYENGEQAGGRIEYVRIFGFVALFILLLASINFTNLATARSAQRSLEVGIRKTFGGSRKSLASQFLGESLLVALFSLLIAAGTLFLLLPGFNAITGKELSMLDIAPARWAQFLGIALLTGVLAGVYPALYLSGIKLMDVLRKGLSRTTKGRGLRRGLVVFQFTVSIVLIVGALTIYNPMDFIRSKNLGLDRENVLYSTLEGPASERFDEFSNRLLQESSIASVAASSQNPMRVGHSTPAPQWDGKDPEDRTLFYIISASHDLIETMGMELADGRTFSRALATDSAHVIVNETAARAMNMDNPVGERFAMWQREGQIIGVVKDFHMASMYSPIEPLVIRLDPSATTEVFIRTRPGQTEEAIAAFERTLNTFNPDYPFAYNFLDTAFEEMYQSEIVIGKLTNYFTVLALFIACLGLFGLASFTTERRTREIAIRKVLGATVSQVIVLLSREFLLLIGIAFAVGAPAAYVLLNNWLGGFEYHVPLGLGVFATAALALIVVTGGTIGYQSVKAALANPARSMRIE